MCFFLLNSESSMLGGNALWGNESKRDCKSNLANGHGVRMDYWNNGSNTKSLVFWLCRILYHVLNILGIRFCMWAISNDGIQESVWRLWALKVSTGFFLIWQLGGGLISMTIASLDPFWSPRVLRGHSVQEGRMKRHWKIRELPLRGSKGRDKREKRGRDKSFNRDIWLLMTSPSTFRIHRLWRRPR